MCEVKMKYLKAFLLGLLVLPGFAAAFDLGNLGSQFNVPSAQFNVIAEGMGEAGVADGSLFNGTVLNPALLANGSHFAEISLGFSISNDVFNLTNYLTNSNNINNLQNAFQNLAPSMQEITQGLQGTPNVLQINQGIAGVQNAVNNLQSAVTNITGRNLQLGAGFNIAMKFDDHWGFQVYNNTHGIVQINQKGLITALENLQQLPTVTSSNPTSIYAAASTFVIDMTSLLEGAFPAQYNELQAAVTTLQANQTSAGVSQFASTVSSIVSSVNQTTFQNALLQDIAEVSGLVYTDTVAMATYSFNPLEEGTPFTLGANFKLVNRRIGYVNSYWLSLQNLNDSSSITNEIKNDIDQSTFRWGLDLGCLYDFDELGISVGATAQDLLHSSATINIASTDTLNPLYGIVTDPAPTVINLGGSWHPLNSLLVDLDLDDLFSATSYYEGMDLFTHAKLGTALNVLGFLQLRGGVSYGNLGGGFGVPFLGLNYAYAVDGLTQSYNHYLNFRAAF